MVTSSRVVSPLIEEMVFFLSTDASVGLYTVPPIQGYMKNLAVRAPGSKRNERRNSVIHIVTRLIQ